MNLGRVLRGAVGDPLLLALVLLLTSFGVAMIFSAGQLDVPNTILLPGLWKAQLTWAAIAVVAMMVVMRVQVRWLEWLAPGLYAIAIGVLLATLVIGTGHGTAASTKSWLRVGPMMVQPAQFANVATVLLLGRVLGAWREAPAEVFDLWKPIAITALPMLLVLAQPDLGTAMVFGGVLLAALFWAGTPIGVIFLLLSPVLGLFLAFVPWMFSIWMLLLIAFLYLYRSPIREAVFVLAANLAVGTIATTLWNSLAPYQRNRFLVFLDPMIDPRGAGYQVIQSKIAIGSGGLLGKGFLEGTQKRLNFLPEQHTDFIYSVIGEEFGFVGTVGVLVLYTLVLWRLLKLAEGMTDPFAGIVVFGIFGAWLTHILVNIGMTVGVMPITGIPLPFLSYGGSFLLATFIALGVAQRVALERGRI
jgi:rod shape determining protein RodA